MNTSNPVSASAPSLGGKVHGGQFPISGATVELWQAGTASGYGAGATYIATASAVTDSGGNFSFATSCSGTGYYLTATGGNAQTGGGANSNIALLAAIPGTCSSSTSVVINEVTTIASVAGLQQFMSINPNYTPQFTGTSNPPWNIGAPSTNTAGLTNAFNEVGQLIPYTVTGGVTTSISGVSGVSTVVDTHSGSNAISPDSYKINTLANILAECVNDTSTGGATYCAPGTAGSVLTLTQTVAENGLGYYPQDTIQAAYNMLTIPNPASSSWKTPGYLSTLFNNISTVGSAFTGGTSAAPLNTAITVRWTETWNSNAGVGTGDIFSLDFDANGNIWTASGNSNLTTYPVASFDHTGALRFTPPSTGNNTASWTLAYYADSATNSGTTTGTVTTPLSYGHEGSNLGIDSNNNAWFSAFKSSTLGAFGGIPDTGLLEEISSAGSLTGFYIGEEDGPLAVDGSNNVYVGAKPDGGSYYLTEANNVNLSTPSYNYYEGFKDAQTINGGSAGTVQFNQLVVDGNQSVWGLPAWGAACGGTGTTTAALVHAPSADIEGTTSSAASGSDVVTLTNYTNYCPYEGAADASGNLWATGLKYNGTANISALMKITTGAVVSDIADSSVTGSGITLATTLGDVAGVAIDGAGNIWAGNYSNSTSTTPDYAGVSEFSSTGQLLSPVTSSTNIGYGDLYSAAGTYAYPLGIIPVAIDNSGNIWLGSTGSSSHLFHVVGVATPAVTPLSVRTNGKIGVTP
jgi:hypothetical protein